MLERNNFDVVTIDEKNLSDKNSYTKYLSNVEIIYSFFWDQWM